MCIYMLHVEMFNGLGYDMIDGIDSEKGTCSTNKRQTSSPKK